MYFEIDSVWVSRTIKKAATLGVTLSQNSLSQRMTTRLGKTEETLVRKKSEDIF